MFDPISLAILAKIGGTLLAKAGIVHASTTAATLAGGAAVSGATCLAGLAIVATCYVVETFAKNAAVKAIAAGVRKFVVWVIKQSWNVVKFLAKTLTGQLLASDTTSWDSLSSGVQQTLNNNGGSFMNQYQA